ncbi:MAG: ribonuclease M5 [Bacillota bacterium]|nr:ribonuclease M5 [Bacillota bacterium]
MKEELVEEGPMKIDEIIIVEGRDDTDAIKKSVDAVTIETHGYGIKDTTWRLIEKAYREKGIIIFTDPDHAGEQIRKRLLKAFPNAKEAFLDRGLATKDGDIGIENASPESIRRALASAKCTVADSRTSDIFTMEDMMADGLVGQADSAERRRQLGQRLGIGYANGKAFLERLNRFAVTREDFSQGLREIDE